MHIDLILASQFLPQIVEVFGARKKGLQIGRFLESNFMTFRHHSQESIDSLGHLVFWPRDGNNVAGLFSIGKIDFAIPLLLQILDFGESGN